jgi:uncharacterized membrane protein (UPF0182 family)
MANYPYSERQSLSDLTHTSLRKGQKNTQINYIRNSVKATVDAYDGTVTLYQWDNKDPLLKAWMSVFPGLVKPGSMGSQMPGAIRDHVRYPQDLFDVQRSLLAQYHITDPVASYNGKGKWAVPTDPFAVGVAADQPPYYVLATPPAGSNQKPQFQLTTPMIVPGGSNNLAAYMSVDSDYGPNYGKITVLEVPTQSNIQGPSQVANVFKSNSTISKDISLLNSGQSEVLHGNLLTLPLGDSFLYVEPLYVQATTGSSFPTLQRVLVTYGDKIGYGATLSDALKDITSGRVAGTSLQVGQTTGNGPSSPSGTPTSTPTGSGTPSGSSSSAPPASVNAILAELDQAVTARNAAYDTHDPTKIAQAEANVQTLVDQLLAARASSSPSSPTSSPKPSPTH